jgi:guanylate kinase
VLVVLTGPSGVGKGTLLARLRERHPELYVSVSATTRAPRPGEVDGVNYHFVTRERFDALIASGALIEWAEYAGHCYGTPRAPVEEQLRAGRPVVLEIEVQGARQIKANLPEAMLVFVQPPSLAELERRLVGRGTEGPEKVARRLAIAEGEIRAAAEFDHQVVNSDLEQALADLEHIVFAETDDR